jgi:hypothetical protein
LLYNDLPEEITAWRAVWERFGLGPQINGHPLIVFQAAQLLIGRAEYRAAELAFREVLARVPDHLPSLHWLVTLLTNRGQADEAAVFRARYEALERGPSDDSPAEGA